MAIPFAMITLFEKLVIGTVALFTAVSGALTESRTVAITPRAPQETAAIYTAATAPGAATNSATSTATGTATSAAATSPAIISGLLPKVTLSPKKPAAAAKPKPAAPTATPTPAPAQTKSVPPPTPAPLAVTAQTFLDGAALSFNERRDGAYEAVFSADIGGGKKIEWGLSEPFIGGDGKIPKFTIAYSCNPPPGLPSPTEIIDKNPFFGVRTRYECDVSLTPTAGADRRIRTRHFSFTTGAGPLVVTPPSSMNTLLKNDMNAGGFVFDNQDAEPVTVTKLTVDVSFTALSTLGGPLVLRFLNPATETSLADYHLENLPALPSSSFAYGATGLEIPLAFTVGPLSQKLLPAQVLGVHKMSISGTNPSITIALRSVVINRATGEVILRAPKIAWSCVVALGAYDPNATSGPFATGEACRE